MTDKEFEDKLEAAITKMKKAKNGKPTIYEAVIDLAKQFGFGSVIVMCMMYAAFLWLPKAIDQNIKLQQSLVSNLDRQTDSMIILQKKAMETEVFRKQVIVEHSVMQIEQTGMANDIHAIKLVNDTIGEEQQRQRQEHKAIVDVLTNLCIEIKKP